MAQLSDALGNAISTSVAHPVSVGFVVTIPIATPVQVGFPPSVRVTVVEHSVTVFKPSVKYHLTTLSPLLNLAVALSAASVMVRFETVVAPSTLHSIPVTPQLSVPPRLSVRVESQTVVSSLLMAATAVHLGDSSSEMVNF